MLQFVPCRIMKARVSIRGLCRIARRGIRGSEDRPRMNRITRRYFFWRFRQSDPHQTCGVFHRFPLERCSPARPLSRLRGTGQHKISVYKSFSFDIVRVLDVDRYARTLALHRRSCETLRALHMDRPRQADRSENQRRIRVHKMTRIIYADRGK